MAMIRFIIIYRLASFKIGRYDHKFLRILKKCTHIKGNKATWNFVKNKIHPEDFSIFNKIRKRDVTLVIYVSEIYFFVSPILSRKIGCCHTCSCGHSNIVREVQIFSKKYSSTPAV